MFNNVPMIGSVSQGFGDKMPEIPSAKSGSLKDAAQDFTGILYAYMFEQMRSSSMDEEGGLFSGEHSSMFMSYLDQEVGRQMANVEGGGLTQQLYEQLGGQQVEQQHQLQLQEVQPEIEKPVDPAQQIMQEIYKINNG